MVPILQREGDINFFQCFFGLIFRPFSTIDKLFHYPKPVFAVGILLLLGLTIIVPVLASEFIHGRMMYQPIQIASLILVMVLTYIYFVFIESIFLMFFRVPSTISGLAHTVSYCLPPLILLLWMMYFANYMTTGTLSFVTLAVTGDSAKDDAFLQAVPTLLNIGFFIAFMVFFKALQRMGDMFATNAIILTLLSIFPFHLSLILAVLSANFINPGTTDTFIQLIYAPANLVVGGL